PPRFFLIFGLQRILKIFCLVRQGVFLKSKGFFGFGWGENFNKVPRRKTKNNGVYGGVSRGLRKKPLGGFFGFGGAERCMSVHDAIPKRKRLIGQFHLVYV
ncbi:hypothetical protein ACVGXE_03585, partial [Escherichia coli]